MGENGKTGVLVLVECDGLFSMIQSFRPALQPNHNEEQVVMGRASKGFPPGPTCSVSSLPKVWFGLLQTSHVDEKEPVPTVRIREIDLGEPDSCRLRSPGEAHGSAEPDRSPGIIS